MSNTSAIPLPPPAGALHSPAADRNRGPIAEVLRQHLPARGTALEIASGSGQHVAHFAQALPGWRWLPSDPQPQAAASIAAWAAQVPGADIAPALQLDVRHLPWPVDAASLDAVLAINLLHIAPWACCAALMQGAAHALRPGGHLVTYGPYLEDGVPLAPGNAAFDADLRARDPAWGLRRREDVEAAARAAGLQPLARVAMPANNLSLVFVRG